MELVKSIDFDPGLISELKDKLKSEVKQLPAIDAETADIIRSEYFNGIYLDAPAEENAGEYVSRLKEKFRKKGYLIFYQEESYDKENIAVIKGTDELDILRYRKTNAINYGMENEDILKKTSEWNSKYGLIILGCSRDWIEISFNTLPDNLNVFAQEVFEFCPDIVYQGVGSVENLEEAILFTQGVWLWWD